MVTKHHQSVIKMMTPFNVTSLVLFQNNIGHHQQIARKNKTIIMSITTSNAQIHSISIRCRIIAKKNSTFWLFFFYDLSFSIFFSIVGGGDISYEVDPLDFLTEDDESVAALNLSECSVMSDFFLLMIFANLGLKSVGIKSKFRLGSVFKDSEAFKGNKMIVSRDFPVNFLSFYYFGGFSFLANKHGFSLTLLYNLNRNVCGVGINLSAGYYFIFSKTRYNKGKIDFFFKWAPTTTPIVGSIRNTPIIDFWTQISHIHVHSLGKFSISTRPKPFFYFLTILCFFSFE